MTNKILSPRLVRMEMVIRTYHIAYARMPTRKELAAALGDKTMGPMSRDLRRLEASGCIKLHPRGTIPAVLT